jgi:hypothetical protein
MFRLSTEKWVVVCIIACNKTSRITRHNKMHLTYIRWLCECKDTWLCVGKTAWLSMFYKNTLEQEQFTLFELLEIFLQQTIQSKHGIFDLNTVTC